MRKIETSLQIDAPANEVWAVLMDFENFPEWNPTIRSIKGKAEVGEQIVAQLCLPGRKPMIFKPRVLKREANREFRWLGHLGVKGIFDGEHYFILKPVDEQTTEFIQGEKFTGLLSGLIFRMIGTDTKKGFEMMNEALRGRVIPSSKNR